MGDIYLIGTAHTDPDGPYRLDKMLKDFSPKRIFLEISDDRAKEILSSSIDDKMRVHEETIEEWTKQGFVLTPDQREKLLELARFKNRSYGFEVKCPLDYQRNHSEVEINYVDLSASSVGTKKRFTEGLREAFGMQNERLTPEMKAKVLYGLQFPIKTHIADFRGQVEFEYQRSQMTAAYLQAMGNDPEVFERETVGLSAQAKASLLRVVDPERNDAIARGIREGHKDDSNSVGIMGASHLYLVAALLEDLDPQVELLNLVPVPK